MVFQTKKEWNKVILRKHTWLRAVYKKKIICGYVYQLLVHALCTLLALKTNFFITSLNAFVLCLSIVCLYCLSVPGSGACRSPPGNWSSSTLNSEKRLQPQLTVVVMWSRDNSHTPAGEGQQDSCRSCWRQLLWQLLLQVTCSLLAESSSCWFRHLFSMLFYKLTFSCQHF